MGERTFGMDGECSSINRLVTNHYIAIFVDENEIRDGDLGEVLRERVEPEVIGQNRITD